MKNDFLKHMSPGNSTRYLFFGGKGGVGKTSMATATAVWFADNGFKTAIVSTDPTVSLSTMFGQEIGGEARTPIRQVANLSGLNINPADAKGVFTRRLNSTMSQMSATMGDDAVSTPCMEEMATFDQFVTFLENPECDVIVFDTAPTGKTLRELAMPFDWAGFLQKQIQDGSKWAELFPGDVNSFEEIDRDKKRYDTAIAVMCNTKSTAFSLVLLPERLPIEETRSAMVGLKKLGIPVQGLVVNQCILPEIIEGNRFLQARADLQAKYLSEIRERFSDIANVQLPLFDHDVSDLHSLREIGRLLYG
jgi:arsenite/tail-anchored protein-transporting ATPase